MPVRDAIRQLTHEGLLVSHGSGRSVVASFTNDDIEDSFHIEGVIHGRAARRAAEHAAAEDVAHLVALHKQMVAAQSAGDLRTVAHLNWEFHRLINLLAHSPKIRALMRTVSIAIPRDYLVDIPEWAARSNAEHEAILAAFTARDLDLVERLVREHAESAGANLVAHLRSRGAPPAGGAAPEPAGASA